jgi:hypothetical protein
VVGVVWWPGMLALSWSPGELGLVGLVMSSWWCRADVVGLV